MSMIRFSIALISMTFLVACSQANQASEYQSVSGDPENPYGVTDGSASVTSGGRTEGAAPINPPGVSAEGAGQGREGGHYLICSPDLPLPYKNCSKSNRTSCAQEKVFFIDYFIMIDSQQDFEALKKFIPGELAEARIRDVVARIKHLFKEVPHMQSKLFWAVTFSDSFMDVKGTARWIEDTRAPHEIELTSDLAPENLTNDKEALVDRFCQGRFFQAAVYDSTRGKADEVFEYSRFFEDYASEMQKSFRNVHEMLRLVLKRGETKQIQSLTAYFHTHEFHNGDEDVVRKKIEEISVRRAAHNPFYIETLPTK